MRVATRRPLLAAAALATLALGACVGDGDVLRPEVNPAGGTLFTRYVSLGNSITAGFQSAGIVDSTQRNAYPNLLARSAGTPFTQPMFARPGCPPLMTAPLVASTAAPTCARVDSVRVPYPGNVAVPGVRIADLFAIPGGQISQLYTLITGGRTQIQAMADAQPTFVSAWIGNNDALSAALSGTLGPLAAGADSNLTRLSSFQASVTAMASSIKASGAQGAVLIGVVFADSASPLLQPGAYFFLSRDAAGKFNGKLVNANCSPVTALGTPNPLSRNLVSFQSVSSALPEINCDPASAQGGAFLLDAAERAVLGQRIADYNAALKAAADANGWLYVNPMDILRPELARVCTAAVTPACPTGSSGRYNQVRKCQLLATAATAAQFQTAVLNSCPAPGPTAAPNFFGALISFDGVHPSTAGHVLVARSLATSINTKYGTKLNTLIDRT
ncbi:MAG TPA: SGNH/GDSL hydrolase family protein [Longimicrobium sp.]|jgi:lysophospholipase L1-like esterase|nr:SGNH/GDSL hydrolase family protein [Longimicrobium sp.]